MMPPAIADYRSFVLFDPLNPVTNGDARNTREERKKNSSFISVAFKLSRFIYRIFYMQPAAWNDFLVGL